MTNNQLAENSITQLSNSVKLARDNAERDDNRVDHSFYYALTIALEELQERRKAAMDSEPVILYRQVNPANGMKTYWAELHPEEFRHLKQYADENAEFMTLYRHAQPPVTDKQPAPVVPDDGRADFEVWMLKRWGRERRDDDFAKAKFIYGEDYADSYTRCVWKAWSACRAAMFNGGKS